MLSADMQMICPFLGFSQHLTHEILWENHIFISLVLKCSHFYEVLPSLPLHIFLISAISKFIIFAENHWECLLLFMDIYSFQHLFLQFSCAGKCLKKSSNSQHSSFLVFWFSFQLSAEKTFETIFLQEFLLVSRFVTFRILSSFGDHELEFLTEGLRSYSCFQSSAISGEALLFQIHNLLDTSAKGLTQERKSLQCWSYFCCFPIIHDSLICYFSCFYFYESVTPLLSSQDKATADRISVLVSNASCYLWTYTRFSIYFFSFLVLASA